LLISLTQTHIESFNQKFKVIFHIFLVEACFVRRWPIAATV